MSASRINYITQEFGIASSAWANNVYTVNTTANNYLFTGVEVRLLGSVRTYTAPVTKISNTRFTIAMTAEYFDNYNSYLVNGYLPGQTGAKIPQAIQRGMATDAIVQSYVTGTGGATYNLEVSLDNTHFVNAASFVHSTTSGDTGFVTISPGWCHIRANLVSVGANTLLTIMSGN